MCGIAGVLDLRGNPVAHETVQRMTDAIAHRGPDGEGHWREGPVGLGHRRLAIIDLSPAGHQPMLDENGAAVLVYNGEIYNFRELRSELERFGRRFRSQSDSEVLLQAYREWGPACLERFNGMFAFAIWDRSSQQLFLARDRYGVKPLYWWTDGRRFAFASEIKALLTLPDLRREVSLPALHQYFTFQNIFTSETLFQGVELLSPGHTLTVSVERGVGTPARYWDYRFGADELRLDESECVDALFGTFQEAAVRQLVSDVPIGSYLSGGMDSGSLTAVAAQHLGRIRSFTAGFDLTSAAGLELGCDERAAAEMMAHHFRTEHYEVVLHAGDMEQVMGDLIWHLEDLRVGQSYPNYYVARLASRFVKVVLSGSGGDELFGGYPWRYFQVAGSRSPDEFFRNYYAFWQRLIPEEDKPRLFNAGTLRAIAGHSTMDVFRDVFSGHAMPLETQQDYINHSLYFEARTFLHGLLVVEDKISMAHGLESRVPFLDNALVDFAMRVPVGFKLEADLLREAVDEDDIVKRQRFRRSSEGKTVLRKAMQRLIPPEIIERKKQGFSGPYESWYRGESLDYIRRLLTSPRARYREFLEPGFVERVLAEHQSATRNHRLLIWSLLCFEVWLRRFM